MNFSLVCAFTSWVFSVTWQDKSAKCPKEAPKVNWAADSGAENIFWVEEPKKVKVHGIWPNFQRFNVFTGRVIFTDRARDNFDLDVLLYLYRPWWLSAWLLWAISYYSPTRPWGLYQTPRFIYDNDHFDNHTYDYQWQWKWWRFRQWPAPALTYEPPPHSSGPIFFPSHHHFNMLPSHPAVFHSWTFWSISKHLAFVLFSVKK